MAGNRDLIAAGGFGKTRSIVLAGVGGQGTITAANLLANALIAHGFDVKTSEVHGMAQRGGSVISMVRFGEHVSSPLVPVGEAEALVVTELIETLRHIPYLAPDGTVFCSRKRIDSLPVLQGAVEYPADAEERLRLLAPRSEVVDADEIAAGCGSAKAANTVLLGMLSTLLPVSTGEWMMVLEREVPPKLVEINRKAFQAGLELMLDR